MADEYGEVLRAKGMLPSEERGRMAAILIWFRSSTEIREGAPDYTGKVCVIGAKLDEEELKKAFGRARKYEV